MLEEFQQRLADEEKRWEKTPFYSFYCLFNQTYFDMYAWNMIDVHACLFCGLFHLISCSDAKDRQERANKTLVNVKAGIEHLADKLQHLKAVGISCKQVSS